MFNQIQKPNFTVENILNERRKIKQIDEEKRIKLIDIEKKYKDASGDFLQLIENYENTIFSQEEGTLVYKNIFTPNKKTQETLKFRNALLKSERGILLDCPICGTNNVSDIDHILNKAKYSDFSVIPINLMPICPTCNRSKLNSEEFFSAYFEDFSDLNTLKVTINFKSNINLPIVEPVYEDNEFNKLKKLISIYNLDASITKDLTNAFDSFVKKLHSEMDKIYNSSEIKDMIKATLKFNQIGQTKDIFEEKVVEQILKNQLDEFTEYINIRNKN